VGQSILVPALIPPWVIGVIIHFGKEMRFIFSEYTGDCEERSGSSTKDILFFSFKSLLPDWISGEDPTAQRSFRNGSRKDLVGFFLRLKSFTYVSRKNKA
jgi:hypothetical protein